MLALAVRAHVALILAGSAGRHVPALVGPGAVAGRAPTRGLTSDRGQTTAEYALVLLGAAGVALLLVAWATKSGAVGKLFDLVLNGIMDKVG